MTNHYRKPGRRKSSEPGRQAGRIDPAREPRKRWVDRLADEDANFQLLSYQEEQLRTFLQANENRIRRGIFDHLEDFPDLVPFPPRRFPLVFDRKTSSLTPADQRLPRNLSRGDIHAAAAWGIYFDLPELPGWFRPAPETIDFALQFQKAQAKALRHEIQVALLKRRMQFRRGIDHYKLMTEGTGVQDVVPYILPPKSKEKLDEEARTPPELAERIAFTVLARVGAHLDPSVEIDFTDYFADENGVDLRLKTVGDNVGLDVTTARDAKLLEEKRRGIQAKQQMYERFFDLKQVYILQMPHLGVESVIQQWEQERGDTAVTPDFFIDRKDIHDIVARAFRVILKPDRTRLYPDEAIGRAIEAVYP